ncbi:DUF262 domain-containing protein [Campylobacter sp. MOP7]|uniref:DUF262 domain-containing protein n=1 Tax=Campylobacter canis TaxID=3378588 RepID=UPI00387E5357
MANDRDFFDIFKYNNVIVHENSIGTIDDLVELNDNDGSSEVVTPDYQRGLVWSEIQKENLIKSILYGAPIGTIVFGRYRTFNEERRVIKNTYAIIDGQQRFNAILGFMNDKFRVCGKLYSELKPLDKTAFLNFRRFDTIILLEPSREIEINFYRTLNFSGTTHTKEDLERLLEAENKPE